jgi:small-conductance mechanosensitive channel/CRP-like cAMP-binding protein
MPWVSGMFADLFEAPLLLASLLWLAAVALPLLVRHAPLWLRLFWHALMLVLLTWFLNRSIGSPLDPHFVAGDSGRRLAQQLMESGWWVIVARIAADFARLVVVLESRPRETQIVSDLLAAGIYVATALAVINFAFGVPIGGLLATSGVIAIVLGLALQNTLSDVFSGIAVGLEKPYKPGDLLWVEGGIEGRVIQINWRSTRIATGHSNVAVVPNSVIAKARLVNRSAPTPVRGDTVEIRLDPAANPEHCLAVLTAAARASRVLDNPAPIVTCGGLQGDGTVYEISFAVADSALLDAARTELFFLVHRHLRHAGIALAVTGMAAPPPVAEPGIAALLAQSDMFSVIDPESRDLLAAHFTTMKLREGATLLAKGEPPQALYVIASGTVGVWLGEGAEQRLVHRMSPGATIGAIGLITGAPFEAAATALTPLRVYRLCKTDIADAIAVRPGLAEGMEALARHGHAELQRLAAHEDTHLAHPEMFLTRLRSFLQLLRD